MPSAPSNQPSNIRQRLKAQALRAKAHAQRAKAHARRAAAHSRRLLAAALIAGTLTLASGGLSQSPSYALDTVSSIDAARTSDLLSNPLREPQSSEQAIESDRQQVQEQLQYWVFSDDFCGWAAVQDVLKPQASFEPVPSALAEDEIVAVDSSASSTLPAGESLTQLLDSLKLDTLLRPTHHQGNWSPIQLQLAADISQGDFIASSPASDEEYLAYDLSDADQVALETYPLSIPHFHYNGGRRTESRPAFTYESTPAIDPALDCLGGGSIWIEEVQPSQSIEITRRSGDSIPASDSHVMASSELAAAQLGQAWERVNDLATAIRQQADRVQRESDAYRDQLALGIVDSIQPGSEARQLMTGDAIGRQLAAVAGSTQQLASAQVQQVTQQISALRSVTIQEPSDAPELTAGERLLLRAGIEANTESMAAAGVADDAAERVCCPVEQMDVASRLPATHALAAVGVATATLKMPHAPSGEPSQSDLGPLPLVKAEALATACDSAADTLERLARTLRQVGDSFIRVARSGADPGLTREPSAEFR